MKRMIYENVRVDGVIELLKFVMETAKTEWMPEFTERINAVKNEMTRLKLFNDLVFPYLKRK